jgi:hypothetical protein
MSPGLVIDPILQSVNILGQRISTRRVQFHRISVYLITQEAVHAWHTPTSKIEAYNT